MCHHQGGVTELVDLIEDPGDHSAVLGLHGVHVGTGRTGHVHDPDILVGDSHFPHQSAVSRSDGAHCLSCFLDILLGEVDALCELEPVLIVEDMGESDRTGLESHRDCGNGSGTGDSLDLVIEDLHIPSGDWIYLVHDDGVETV